MSDVSTQPRALSPRKLEQQESRQSLNHWRTVFRNFYRRCQYYSLFLLPSTHWDQSQYRGFTQENSGLKRDPETLASDLEGFLDCVASYLPFDYVAEKLRSESHNIQSVWSIIYEIYDAELTTTNYLDYGSMTKEPEETYRNFFNRLVGFARQHLPTEAVEAEGVKCSREGEVMSIGLLDAIAVHWLNSIDKRLINIIKMEFSTELKTKRLCEMVKPIAKVIDDLLTKHTQQDQVASLSTTSLNDPNSTSPTVETADLIRRIEKLEFNRRQPARQPTRRTTNNFNKSQNSFQRSSYCTHCAFINNQLGSSLQTNHFSSACNRKNVSISLIDVADAAPSLNSSEEEYSYYEGESKCLVQNSTGLLQNDEISTSSCLQAAAEDEDTILPCFSSQNIVQSSLLSTHSDSNIISDNKYPDNCPRHDYDNKMVTQTCSIVKAGNFHPYDKGPVSYTHLTLPTNREV